MHFDLLVCTENAYMTYTCGEFHLFIDQFRYLGEASKWTVARKRGRMSNESKAVECAEAFFECVGDPAWKLLAG